MNNQNLKDWFLHIRRLLPWRENINPYRVWISEIMLQQTRVSTVIPYFIKWMEIFPNIEALAAAPLEKVIKVWEGLGYYSRARSIHKTAGILLEQYKGIFPMTIQELEKLPGIRTYTSRATSIWLDTRKVTSKKNQVSVLLYIPVYFILIKMVLVPRNTICSGCKASFTYSELSRHLAQSHDIRCIAVQQNIEDYSINVNDIETDLQDSPEYEPQPQQFQGDYFGKNY